MTQVLQQRITVEALTRNPEPVIEHAVDALVRRLPDVDAVAVVEYDPGRHSAVLSVYYSWTDDHTLRSVLAGVMRRVARAVTGT